jgi:hypothetical protein
LIYDYLEGFGGGLFSTKDAQFTTQRKQRTIVSENDALLFFPFPFLQKILNNNQNISSPFHQA